jgi:glycosyltransferase involved in cell wall biosynthesis
MDNLKEKENSQPWVTFCMSTYKRPEFLRKQLAGILKQTFRDFAVIISDNDPAGSAKGIVRSLDDPRIEYYTNESNLGMVKSFNRSLAKARSEYVVMITDDDPVYPDMLQTLYDLALQYPGYGMYYGGCDIQCDNPTVARSSRLKVGTNSCLADLPIGTIRTYQSNAFPFAYFNGSLGCHLLWSAGIVKRDIALKIGGMPDFGAPYNTDFAYVVLSGAQQGAVLINTSVGCQVVHGTNYGYTEADYEKFYITPNSFYRWVMERLPKDHDYTGLDKLIETFLGRWVVEYAVSIKKVLNENKKIDRNFEDHVRKIFQIPYLRKWKKKYFIASRFPNLFEILVDIKKRFAGS